MEFSRLGIARSMIARAAELEGHVRALNNVLAEICDSPRVQRLVGESDGIVAVMSLSAPLGRRVTTDLGRTEIALRLPVPDPAQPRYWIGLHELWEWKNKRTVQFRESGIRLYVGRADEDVLQFLRLEWIAPTEDPDEKVVYAGSHAGHPHWHIDRSALVGPEEQLRSLEALTTPDRPIEEFSEATVSIGATATRLIYDCSWLQKMHLPAHASWMLRRWDGRVLPAPHQCEPESLTGLGSWWAAALRYLIAELPH
jgi:hypothetical protein